MALPVILVLQRRWRVLLLQRICHLALALLSLPHHCSKLLTFTSFIVNFKRQKRGTWDYSMWIIYLLLVLAKILQWKHVFFPPNSTYIFCLCSYTEAAPKPIAMFFYSCTVESATPEIIRGMRLPVEALKALKMEQICVQHKRVVCLTAISEYLGHWDIVWPVKSASIWHQALKS